MRATNKNICCECYRPATCEVLVPWIHQTTREEGADWTPFCWFCYPSGEKWATMLLPKQRTLANAIICRRFTGHNGIISEEDAVAELESRD